MPRGKRHGPKLIIAKLGEAEVALAQGRQTVP